jgi:hypothetical protein
VGFSLEIKLCSGSVGRRPAMLMAAKHIGDVRPESTGSASAV